MPPVFIYRAIYLVSGNIFLGIFLAVGVLWWFLRRIRATLIIAAAIPISLLATFIMLNAAGRSLNVISLAGLAFAVGMVMDAAIVVLENIVRLREKDLPANDASLQGSSQVWGALLASTATTVAIFLPVLFMREVEGQLFADLAITIAIAVIVSTLVAVTIIPLAARTWLRETRLGRPQHKIVAPYHGAGHDDHQHPRKALGDRQGMVSLPLGCSVSPCCRSWIPATSKARRSGRLFLVSPGRRARPLLPASTSQVLDERMAPFMSGEREPALKNYYILNWPGGGTIGAQGMDQGPGERPGEDHQRGDFCRPAGSRALRRPGQPVFGFRRRPDDTDPPAVQGSGRAGGGCTAGPVNAGRGPPNIGIVAHPALEQAEPELQLAPNDRRISEAGWSRSDVGVLVRALGRGQYVGEHFNGEKRMDIILRAQALGLPGKAGGRCRWRPPAALLCRCPSWWISSAPWDRTSCVASTAAAPSPSISTPTMKCPWSTCWASSSHRSNRA